MGVEEWFLFDWIALGSGGVSPGDVERAAAVVADFADSGLAFGDGTAMSASEAAHAIVVELLEERGIGFADLLVENGAEGGHGNLWLYSNAAEWRRGYALVETPCGAWVMRCGYGVLRLRRASLSRSTASAQDDRVVSDERFSSGRGRVWRLDSCCSYQISAFCSMATAWACVMRDSQDFGEGLAVLVSGSAGQDGPEVGLGQAWGNAAASPVTSAERGLGLHVSVLGCFDEPGGGFLVILLYAFARRRSVAQEHIRPPVRLCRQLAELVEGCGLDGRGWRDSRWLAAALA